MTSFNGRGMCGIGLEFVILFWFISEKPRFFFRLYHNRWLRGDHLNRRLSNNDFWRESTGNWKACISNVRIRSLRYGGEVRTLVLSDHAAYFLSPQNYG